MSATSARATSTRVRTRVRVEGTVQGVGFRPFVYRIAAEEGLGGLRPQRRARRAARGRGRRRARCARFVARLSAEAPPLAAVERVACDALAPRGERGFRILESARTGAADAPVTADTATCADCLAELLDPADRRHRYPFINCTNCGPRFTIVRGVPYDRPLTTMAAFRDVRRLPARVRGPARPPLPRPAERLPARAGPRVRAAATRDGAARSVGRPARATRSPRSPARLAAGAIVAVKGIGGFHLVCDAADERAVAALRARKHREDKPFALMVRRRRRGRGGWCALDAEDERLLTSPARPIVLAPRRPGAPVAAVGGPGRARARRDAPLHARCTTC